MKILPPYTPPYPQPNVFPGLSGEIMHRFTTDGVAPELIGTQLIAFISLLTQAIADVAWPNGLKSPIGVNSFLVAPSGVGKSFIFKILIEAIELYLVELSNKYPTKRLDFLIEDATREAIVQSLHGWLVAGLFTDEAGMLKQLLKDAPTLAKLLDASPLRSARVSTGRVELFGQRFCMLLMEQPNVFEATKVLLGASKGGVGLINRFFVARVNGSVAGRSLHHVGLSASVKQAYEKKVRELLDASIQQVEKQTRERPALHLSAEAAQYVVHLDNEIRQRCVYGAPWFFISEYVSRHVERVLRLAGAFHVFEHGIEGEISIDTIQRAAILGQWYIEAFAQMVYEPPKLTQTETDAITLERAIHEVFHTAGLSLFRQSDMRTHALNLGLTPTRFTRALAALAGQGKVRVLMQRNTPWVESIAVHFSRYR
jgi:hypothetical protein